MLERARGHHHECGTRAHLGALSRARPRERVGALEVGHRVPRELTHDGFHDLIRLTDAFGSPGESIVSDFELIEHSMPWLAPLIAQVHAREFFSLGALEVSERHPPDIEAWIEQTRVIYAHHELFHALGQGARREELSDEEREIYDALVVHMGSSEALDALVVTDPEQLEHTRTMELSMIDGEAANWREILLALGKHDEAARVESFRVSLGCDTDDQSGP